MIKDSPGPGLCAQVTLAALGREVVGGCRRSVATSAIREAGVVKHGIAPVLHTAMALAALAGEVALGCVRGVTALAVGGVGVVEGGSAPGCRRVALAALAGKVALGCEGSVALVAIGETSVVKDGAAPGIGGVAGSASCSERAQVDARFRVAGVTRLGDIRQDTMWVAFVARQSDVCARELKVCEVVVKGSLSPAISHVALGTILP
jgi:hypothetical protein